MLGRVDSDLEGSVVVAVEHGWLSVLGEWDGGVKEVSERLMKSVGFERKR